MEVQEQDNFSTNVVIGGFCDTIIGLIIELDEPLIISEQDIINNGVDIYRV